MDRSMVLSVFSPKIELLDVKITIRYVLLWSGNSYSL